MSKRERERERERANLVVNDGGETEVVKYLCAVAPDIDRAIFPPTLVIESIHLWEDGEKRKRGKRKKEGRGRKFQHCGTENDKLSLT